MALKNKGPNVAHRLSLLFIILVCLSLLTLLVSCQQEGGEEPETTEDLAATPTTAVVSTVPSGTLAPPLQLTSPATTTARRPTATLEPTPMPAVGSSGSLIAVSMESQVGVLLDELPQHMRDRAAEWLIDQPEEYWLGRARRQVELTMYRLDFRGFSSPGKGQLPLPPAQLWSLRLTDTKPSRQTIAGHDLITVSYTFTSTLLTDTTSPGEAEPVLSAEGGVWEEPFILPIDPELLFQRTGNACINEGGFPPNSYDSENIATFYDHTCTADSGGPLGCHRSQLPQLSCIEALDARVGRVDTVMRFERLPWDADLADQVRVGPLTSEEAADLMVVEEDLVNHRIIYRYFAPDSCAVVEQCVSGTGWRRLLQFDATVHNVGAQPLHIGPVVAENPLHNLFQYNACHDHFHFSNYGDFILNTADQALASKQAFCVESTGRYSNNETSPLTHSYTCRFQGVQAGWVDEYGAGLDCQWIDITDVYSGTAGASLEPVLAPLRFDSNPDQFLCEGTPVLDAAGSQLWEPSGLTTNDGRPIQRPQCDFIPDWDVNNSGTHDVLVPPTGGFVTAPCAYGQLGPLRNCDFSEQPDPLTCVPGETVQLSCRVPAGADPQTLRVCETSAVLGSGVACTYQDALANLIVDSGRNGRQSTELTFTCPLPRDEREPGGSYTFYTAPVFPTDELQPVTCEPVP